MQLKLQKSSVISNSKITITGSKSESNRLLLLQALYPKLKIKNASNSDDSKVMENALLGKSDIIDVHHAGTAMRFLTAFFATQKGREVVLKGSSRMHERPIAILVDTLNQLGAKITYLEKEGFPPLQIKGKKFSKRKASLQANVSSQYISALLLIAPKLKKGLKLILKGEVTSVPYINMTLNLLNEIGVKTSFKENIIQVKAKKKIKKKKLIVESDWSSASYFYSIIALSEVDTEIRLTSYKKNSLQGDSVLEQIYQKFGVTTVFLKDEIIIRKVSKTIKHIALDLKNAPDIAQTIAVTCFGLGISCKLTGLHTLKIKETDRLVALKIELEKLGGFVSITANSLELNTSKSIKSEVKIATYQDHRMAMAFAPLALKIAIIIEEASVVSKSYPSFWDDLKAIGFNISE